MHRRLIPIVALLVMLPLAASAQTTVKVLFDATKAETAGGADWILDADAPCSGRVSFPQQLPTPDQATITDTDTESAWSGAFSNWGIDLVQRRFTPGHAFEYVVETLPADGAITFGDGDNPQDLANYDILILAEPNSLFTTAEKNAIAAFVQNGGGLFLIADHAGDDRNNDGWDCPEVLNDLEATLGLGIHFQELGETNNTVSQDPATAFMTDWSTESPILDGPFGSASTSRGFAFHGSTTMVLDTGVNPTWKGHVFLSQSDVGTGSNVLIASCEVNSAGRVVVVADTSPFEDGTPTCTGDDTFFDWADTSRDHRTAFLNATEWLAQAAPDTTPPSITSGPTVTAYDCWAVVEWDTDEPASSVVEYGPDTGYGSTATSSGYSFHHSVTVEGLTAGQAYHFRVVSDDFAGNGPAASADATFTTTAATAPVITVAPAVTAEADTWIAVTWTTDEPSTSEAEYGPDTGYGTSTGDPSLVTEHTLTLTGLAPSTDYHLRVRSLDRCGNASAWSADLTAVTRRPGLDISGWTIEDTVGGIAFTIPPGTVIQAGSYLLVGHEQDREGFEGEWHTTLDPLVVYLRSLDSQAQEFPVIDDTQRRFQLRDDTATLVDGPTPGTLTTKWKTNQRTATGADATDPASWGTSDTIDATPGTGGYTLTSAGVVITEFSDNYYDASGTTSNGSWRGEFVELFYDDGGVPDTDPPVITAGPAAAPADCTAVITWTTDEDATSSVEYGPDTGYGSSAATAGYTTEHAVTLEGLSSGTTYHFRVASADRTGNGPTYSADATFTTTAPSPPAFTAGPAITGTGSTTLTVEWTTDEPTTGTVEYGQDTGYGNQVADATPATHHAVTLTGLAPETTYHLRVSASDTCGNGPTWSADLTGTTTAATVDISGWTVHDTVADLSFTFPSGTVLAPGDLVVIGRQRDRAAFESLWGVTLPADVHYFDGSAQVTNGFPQINSTNRAYELLDGAAAVRDVTAPGLTTYSNSTTRTSPAADGSLAASWSTADWSTATPGGYGVTAGTGSVVITEMSDNRTDYTGEFIELFFDGAAAPAVPVPDIVEEIFDGDGTGPTGSDTDLDGDGTVDAVDLALALAG